MALSNPFVRGRNVKISYRQNGIKQLAVFKSVSIEEISEEIADDVNGEQRSRFDLVVSGYKVSLEGFAPDFALLDSFLVDTANDDISNPQLTKAIQMTLQLLDASTRVYRFSGKNSARGSFKVEASDRKSAVMQSVSYRFPFMQAVTV